MLGYDIGTKNAWVSSRRRQLHVQVMEIVCDCANARVVGEGHLGSKPLDGSDPVEQAEKIAQVREHIRRWEEPTQAPAYRNTSPIVDFTSSLIPWRLGMAMNWTTPPSYPHQKAREHPDIVRDGRSQKIARER